MKRPYTICHMMTSIDGRIDCPMTEQLPGVEEYYRIVDELDAGAHISGRYTAELEMASGIFSCEEAHPYGKEGFYKAQDSACYEITVDTRGRLLWENGNSSLLIITSEEASKEYLDYLTANHISWIATGKGHEGLPRAMEILAEEFGVKRAAVLGGPVINTAFLENGLLDEVSLLIGSGIDGRGGMQAVFDGRAAESKVKQLTLTHVSQEGNALWVRYKV